ncbi:iron-sulfur cluster biosynthesis family protein [Domibacillus indicus]|uniref:iron-sulfur cluster biosynthesis family protein n=1 Tax=Domibacillus indicus TaxID=1437523 RepID=UPI000617FAD8|nr:iron-sulfur cluster biosynthesis family protein [Domibacillus indicus]
MNIILTEAARQQLLDWPIEENAVIRLDANVSGGCGMAVQFSIVLDEPRRNDTAYDCGHGIFLCMDLFTRRYLEEELIIDYTNASGFSFADSFGSSC